MDYWDTAVERGSTDCGASLKKIGAMFPAGTIFPFQRRVAPTVNC
jgi:hypothetical protein